MPKLRTLRVYPNPYSFIDHEGRPHGTFDADPIQHDPNARKIGVVSFKATPLSIRSTDKGDDRPSIHDVLFSYSDEVQVLPDGNGVEHGPSAHARMGLKQGARVVKETRKDKDGKETLTWSIVLPGALVAADEETAKSVGLPFGDPVTLLAAAREDAIKRWTADYGEPPAFATDPDYEAHVPELLRGIKPKPKSEAALQLTTKAAPDAPTGGK